jgi:hypothetical protein
MIPQRCDAKSVCVLAYDIDKIYQDISSAFFDLPPHVPLAQLNPRLQAPTVEEVVNVIDNELTHAIQLSLPKSMYGKVGPLIARDRETLQLRGFGTTAWRPVMTYIVHRMRVNKLSPEWRLCGLPIAG